ncbi:MAG: glycosyltransferase family 2 protein [Lachnospiraceae bacterium]|nr:glycosyltransferase family 2 protein [Lachnospiraceae bacterium]
MEDKVSIITPLYNSERYVADTIRSVQAQTYQNWEMILVNDCSTDSSVQIVEEFAAKDPRIRLLHQKEQGGAAKARNHALECAEGRFIAYLDSDDLWKPDKLEKQVRFMKKKKIGFSCTSYEVIDDAGKSLDKQVYMLPKVDYVGFLTNNLLQTVGIMADLTVVDRKYLVMPDMRRRQDAATWLQVLKAGFCCYGMKDILAEYRRAAGSLSSNKLKAVKGVWKLYRDVEHLSLPFSCYCFVRYAVLAVWKRIYLSR